MLSPILISTLEGYIANKYNLILTSHYTPEDINDVETKIEYLKSLKEIYKQSKDSDTFKKNIMQNFQIIVA